MNWNGENEIAAKTLSSFKEKAAQLGIEVIDKDAHNNDKEQYAQAMDLIDQGIKVLIMKPVNSVTAASIVREANKKGVTIVANDQLIKNCKLDYFVTFDSRKVGEYMAREALKRKPKGTYILLWGDKADDNADIVKGGVLKVLQPEIDKGNVKVLYATYIEAWSLENAVYDVDMVVRLSSASKIDAVIASSDDMARGAIKVLKENDLLTDDTFVSGQNADLASLKMIVKHEQTVTIAKSPKTVGYALAELSARLVSKDYKTGNSNATVTTTFNGDYDVPTILFDPVVVDKSNVEKVVLNDGLVSKEVLYSND